MGKFHLAPSFCINAGRAGSTIPDVSSPFFPLRDRGRSIERIARSASTRRRRSDGKTGTREGAGQTCPLLPFPPCRVCSRKRCIDAIIPISSATGSSGTPDFYRFCTLKRTSSGSDRLERVHVDSSPSNIRFDEFRKNVASVERFQVDVPFA